MLVFLVGSSCRNVSERFCTPSARTDHPAQRNTVGVTIHTDLAPKCKNVFFPSSRRDPSMLHQPQSGTHVRLRPGSRGMEPFMQEQTAERYLVSRSTSPARSASLSYWSSGVFLETEGEGHSNALNGDCAKELLTIAPKSYWRLRQRAIDDCAKELLAIAPKS